MALLPALRDLRRSYPAASLHVLTSPLGTEVLALVPDCVDRAWPVELHPEKRSWSEHRRVLAALRAERFDLAINFSGADRSIFLTAASGARVKVAHEAGRKHVWNRWLIRHWVPRRDPILPAFEQRRQVLGACGLALEPARFELRVPPEAKEWAAKESRISGCTIHFSLNASTPLKEWPLDNWTALARQLLAARPDLRIVASGSASLREQERLRAFVAQIADPRVALLPAPLSIARLAAALECCRAHVGADSGVLHLAVALGLPTVSFFRQYEDASAWMPVGPAHRVLSAPCECVNQARQPCAADQVPRCLARIAPGTALDSLLPLLPPRES